MYKTLQERYLEVKNNRRLKRRRRKQRLNERKQELLNQFVSGNQAMDGNNEDNQDNDTMNKQEEVSPRNLDQALDIDLVSEWTDKMNITNHIIDDNTNQTCDAEYSDQKEDICDRKDMKTSKGSKQRHKSFLAKFHPLE
jgi:hypothetical protein